MMTFWRAATVSLEIAHRGENGVLHGHSLSVEVLTHKDTCLDVWKAEVTAALAYINLGQLEETIKARTFEDVIEAIFDALPDASHVSLRLPSYGHVIHATRS